MTDSEHHIVSATRKRLAEKSVPKAKERGMSRYSRVNQINRPRHERRTAECFGPCSRAARLSPCAVPGCKSLPPQDPAHVRSRGAGGLDWANVVGLCSKHHREQHDSGMATFCARYRISLEDVACQIAEVVRGHACEDWPERSRKGLRCSICLKPTEGP